MNKALPLFILCYWAFMPLTSSAQAGWQWGRTGVGYADSWALATDTFGNVFAGGWVSEDGFDFGGGVTIPAGTFNPPFWVKYNNAGIPLWVGSVVGGNSYLNNIATDPSGNLIVFGEFNSPNIHIGPFTLTNALPGGSAGGSFQYFLAKVSPSGTVLWAINDGEVSHVFSVGYPFGGIEMLSDGGVATDDSGNIYITSSFDSARTHIGPFTLTNAGTTSASSDIFVAKYSPAGTPLWARSFGGDRSDWGLGIAVAATGNVYVTGAFESDSMTVGSATLLGSSSGIFIAECSPAGAPLWGQSPRCTVSGHATPFGAGIAKDNFGNIYVTGGFLGASISFGSITAVRPLPYPTGIGSAEDAYALFLARYSPSDSVIWVKAIGGPTSGPVWGNSIATTPWSCGQVWVSGTYDSDVNIDGHILPPVPGVDPVFIAGYNISGDVVSYSGVASGGDDQNGIACDPAGNIFLSSDCQAPSTIVFGPDTVGCSRCPFGEFYYLSKYANPITFDTGGGTIAITASPGDTVCPDSPVTFTATVTGGVPVAYQWIVNGSPVGPGASSYTYTPADGDSVRCTITIAYCSHPDTTVSSNTINIAYVDEASAIYIIASPGDTVCPGDTITFTAITNWGGSSPGYQWKNNGVSIGAGADIYSYVPASGDAISCTLTSSYPCDASPVSSNIINVVISNCNTQVKNIASQSLSIHPNPAGNELIIAAAVPITEIVITNLLGQIVAAPAISKGEEARVNVAGLPDGVYFVKVNSTEFGKFVKE